MTVNIQVDIVFQFKKDQVNVDMGVLWSLIQFNLKWRGQLTDQKEQISQQAFYCSIYGTVRETSSCYDKANKGH